VPTIFTPYRACNSRSRKTQTSTARAIAGRTRQEPLEFDQAACLALRTTSTDSLVTVSRREAQRHRAGGTPALQRPSAWPGALGWSVSTGPPDYHQPAIKEHARLIRRLHPLRSGADLMRTRGRAGSTRSAGASLPSPRPDRAVRCSPAGATKTRRDRKE